MKTGDILVIDKIEEAQDNKGKTYLKVTDKAGVTHNIKEGRTNLLTNKGHLLKEGEAIKVQFTDYKNPDGKVFPFISDFEPVKDVFAKEAVEKVQVQAKDTREASIETQVAAKIAVELLVGKVIDLTHPLAKVALSWALTKLETKEIKVEKETKEVKDENIESTLEVKTDTPQGDIPDTAEVMADLKTLYDHKPRIWTTSKMMEELSFLGYTGAKVIDVVQSLPLVKLLEFHDIVKKALPKEVK